MARYEGGKEYERVQKCPVREQVCLKKVPVASEEGVESYHCFPPSGDRLIVSPWGMAGRFIQLPTWALGCSMPLWCRTKPFCTSFPLCWSISTTIVVLPRAISISISVGGAHRHGWLRERVSAFNAAVKQRNTWVLVRASAQRGDMKEQENNDTLVIAECSVAHHSAATVISAARACHAAKGHATRKAKWLWLVSMHMHAYLSVSLCLARCRSRRCCSRTHAQARGMPHAYISKTAVRQQIAWLICNSESIERAPDSLRNECITAENERRQRY